MAFSRRSWFFILIGCVAALFLAGPVIGAAWGLISIHRYASDGNNSVSSAHRIVSSIRLKGYVVVDLPPMEIRHESDCEMEVERKAFRPEGGVDPGAEGLIVAVDHWKLWLLDQYDDGVEDLSLSALPTFVLKGLEGCINASLLASWCERYVDKHVSSATASDWLRRKIAKTEQDDENLWCYISKLLPEQKRLE